MFRKFLTISVVLLGWLMAYGDGGHWMREEPVILNPRDRPAQTGQWPAQNGWTDRLYSVAVDQVTFGSIHADPAVQSFWSEVKAYWSEPPQVLRPGQKISFRYGLQFGRSSRWTEAAVLVYKMSGVDGGDRLLGSTGPRKTSLATATKPYLVVDGNGSPPETRLKFLFSVPDRARASFSYRWVNGSGQPGTTVQSSFVGTWVRLENGRVIDKMTIRMAGQGFELLFQESDTGPIIARGTGRLEGLTLVADSWQLARTARVVRLQMKDAQTLHYLSSNPDGSAPWSGDFHRQ